MNAHDRTQAKLAYQDFLGQIHDRYDPASGWQNVGQLPNLTASDMGVCLAADESLMDDIQVCPDQVAELLRAEGFEAAREYIADSIMSQLRTEIRRQLLRDLFDRAEDREVAGYEAGVLAEAL